jgi:hypothetical protein
MHFAINSIKNDQDIPLITRKFNWKTMLSLGLFSEKAVIFSLRMNEMRKTAELFDCMGKCILGSLALVAVGAAKGR